MSCTGHGVPRDQSDARELCDEGGGRGRERASARARASEGRQMGVPADHPGRPSHSLHGNCHIHLNP